MREKIKLGVAGDFGVSGQKGRELGIIARDVFLIREKRWIMRNDGGECGAETE
jgi:hypothetical protein